MGWVEDGVWCGEGRGGMEAKILASGWKLVIITGSRFGLEFWMATCPWRLKLDCLLVVGLFW
jgi:hypothetical protein